MIVTCIENVCNSSVLLLPIHADEPLNDDNFVVVMGYSVNNQTMEYSLKKGMDYTVYGILCYAGEIRFLVQDENGWPFFCPECLFVVKDHQAYWEWSVSTFTIAGKSLLIMGYPEIKSKENYSNLIDLIKKNDVGIRGFLEYKDYYEKYSLD